MMQSKFEIQVCDMCTVTKVAASVVLVSVHLNLNICVQDISVR